MLNAAGVDIHERSGSRALLKKEQKGIVVHRPHPEPETNGGTVRPIVDFLKKTRVEPQLNTKDISAWLNLTIPRDVFTEGQ